MRNRPSAFLSLRTPADLLFARQTFDRSRRSLEYCIYQRELQDVGDMLDQIEEERRRDVDNANSKREEYNGREKELSVRSRLRVPSICSSLIPAVLAEPRQPPVDSPRIALDPRDRAPRAQPREARPRPGSLEPRVCRRRRRRRGALRRRATHERAGSARARRGRDRSQGGRARDAAPQLGERASGGVDQAGRGRAGRGDAAAAFCQAGAPGAVPHAPGARRAPRGDAQAQRGDARTAPQPRGGARAREGGDGEGAG